MRLDSPDILAIVRMTIDSRNDAVVKALSGRRDVHLVDWLHLLLHGSVACRKGVVPIACPSKLLKSPLVNILDKVLRTISPPSDPACLPLMKACFRGCIVPYIRSKANMSVRRTFVRHWILLEFHKRWLNDKHVAEDDLTVLAEMLEDDGISKPFKLSNVMYEMKECGSGYKYRSVTGDIEMRLQASDVPHRGDDDTENVEPRDGARDGTRDGGGNGAMDEATRNKMDDMKRTMQREFETEMKKVKQDLLQELKNKSTADVQRKISEIKKNVENTSDKYAKLMAELSVAYRETIQSDRNMQQDMQRNLSDAQQTVLKTYADVKALPLIVDTKLKNVEKVVEDARKTKAELETLQRDLIQMKSRTEYDEKVKIRDRTDLESQKLRVEEILKDISGRRYATADVVDDKIKIVTDAMNQTHDILQKQVEQLSSEVENVRTTGGADVSKAREQFSSVEQLSDLEKRLKDSNDDIKLYVKTTDEKIQALKRDLQSVNDDTSNALMSKHRKGIEALNKDMQDAKNSIKMLEQRSDGVSSDDVRNLFSNVNEKIEALQQQQGSAKLNEVVSSVNENMKALEDRISQRLSKNANTLMEQTRKQLNENERRERTDYKLLEARVANDHAKMREDLESLQARVADEQAKVRDYIESFETRIAGDQTKNREELQSWRHASPMNSPKCARSCRRW